MCSLIVHQCFIKEEAVTINSCVAVLMAGLSLASCGESRLKWDTFFKSPTHLLQPKNRVFVGKLDDKANDAQHTSEGVFAEAEQVVAHTNVFKKADRATTVPKVLQMFQA